MNPRPTRLRSLAAAGFALASVVAAAPAADAAIISELFLDGPAGQALELTGIDDAQGATLAILDGSRHDSAGFAKVLDVVHLQPGQGWSPVVLLTDNAWPESSVPATPVAGLSPASGATTLNFGLSFHDRILVVFDGISPIQVNDQPRTDPLASARFNTSGATDWLVFGGAGLAQAYDAKYDDAALADINAALGIDLLARTADRSAGTVFARTHTQGQPTDLGTTYVGTPDANGRFDVGGGLAYRTTPGLANVPLVDTVPEPGTLAALALGGLALGGRRRRVV